jgi:hypothetical protein
MSRFIRASLIVLALAGSAVVGRIAQGQDFSSAAVRNSLAEMHTWVGDIENRIRWQRFLKSEQLLDQVERGIDADRDVVRKIPAIYAGDTPGLERWRFVAVRDALANWLASLPIPPRSLSETILGWQDQFEPISASEVVRRRSALESSLERLEGYLFSGSRANAEKWQRYLKWEDMQAQLAAGNEANLGIFQESLRKYFAKYEGLETEPFTSTREALLDYMNALLPRTQEQYSQRLEALARQVGETQAEWTHEKATAMGRIVGWLDSGELASGVVDAVRAEFWEPNLYARVSRDLMAYGVRDQVNQTQAVNEFILGTSIHGTADMNASIDMQLVPNRERATFDLTLDGVANSSTVGYNGPVTIDSSSVTGLYASKRVYIDVEGLSWDYSEANGWTSSTIHCIAARSRLVRKIAWKRANASKSQAEQIAAGRASSRVAGQFDDQAAGLLTEVNEKYREMVRNPLIRRDAFPRLVRFETDANALRLRMLHASVFQLAAPNRPPAIESAHDLSVRLHESVVGNFSESMLGGETLTDEGLVELLEEANAEVPDELRISPDKDPWSITFSPDQPIRVRFHDSAVRIGIRGRRFTRGEQEIRSTIEISATYQLENAGGRSRLTRVGEVEVDYINRPRLSVAQVAMKTFLKTKFEALFEAEIVSEGLVLRGRWEKAGTLELRNLEANEGWLSLDWQTPDQTIRTARVE